MGEYIKLISNCSSSHVSIGDIITYNIVCTNDSNVVFSDIFISNDLNLNLKFVKGSIKINNIDRPDLSILSGVSIGRLGTSCKSIVAFEVEVISKFDDAVTLNTCAECVYKENNEDKSIIEHSTVVLYIYNPSIYIKKSVDKSNVSLNDKITYKIKLVNDGDLYLDKIVLKDDIYENLEIVDGSFIVNSKIVNDFDLEKGVIVGNLGVNDYILIQYEAVVKGKGVCSQINNKAFVSYTYYFDNGSYGIKNSEVINCPLNVSLPSFKQIYIEEYIYLPEHKDDIHCVENVNTDIIINSYHTIKTPIATSNEGTVLSGHKLIVHGSINQIVRYTTIKSSNAVHSFEYEMPFSTFIILPCDYQIGSKIQIETKEEYTHFSLVNRRCIFENISILILVKIMK
ncbi:MAG: hypothetical protein ACRCXA_08315 [Peptostreptococcaceae bacterium]